MEYRGWVFLLCLICQWLRVFSEVRQVSVSILSPQKGSTFQRSSPEGIELHVKIDGMLLPAEGYAELLLDGELIAAMPENEVYMAIENVASLSVGHHVLSVRLLNNAGEALGAEQESEFFIAADSSENEVFRFSKSCDVDARHTTATGAGLKKASAGTINEFAIYPRDRFGDIIDPELCPEALPLVVIVQPAPFDHKLQRSADGIYHCTWTAEYSGKYKVEIKIKSHSEVHIQGSPFHLEVKQMVQVTVTDEIRPTPSAFGGRLLHSSREARHHIPAVAAGEPLVEGGDDDGIRAACAGHNKCAFVAMMSGDAYLVGMLTLYYSVRKTGTTADFIVMCTRDGNSEHTLTSLQKAGLKLYFVDRMKKRDISDMSEERWNDNYTKLRLWQMNYKKIIFLDSDMIVLQPLDHLFTLKAPFAAVPDAFHPCYLNTGFMVIEPSNTTFQALVSLIDDVSSEESEQTLVNHYFLDRYHVLHYTYNYAKHTVMSPTRHEIYVDRYIDTVKVVHFLGVKPWMCSRDRDCMRHVTYYSGNSNMYLYDLWWSMLEEMCELHGVICQS